MLGNECSEKQKASPEDSHLQACSILHEQPREGDACPGQPQAQPRVPTPQARGLETQAGSSLHPEQERGIQALLGTTNHIYLCTGTTWWVFPLLIAILEILRLADGVRAQPGSYRHICPFSCGFVSCKPGHALGKKCVVYFLIGFQPSI